MAFQASNGTPAMKRQFPDAVINSATRKHAILASVKRNMDAPESNGARLKTFLTPRKSSGDSDDHDDDEGGGVLLTPQPRRGNAAKNVANSQEHHENGGGVSLSAPRATVQSPRVWSAETQSRQSSGSYSGGDSIQGETGFQTAHDYCSNDGAETVATSHQTVTSYSETQGSSPNTVSSGANNTFTPKTNGLSAKDAIQLIQTAPARFEARPLSRRGITNEPPPTFDLNIGTKVSSLIGTVITQSTQSTPMKAPATGAFSSPVKTHTASTDIFRKNFSPAPASDVSSVLARRGIDFRPESPMTSAGSVASGHGSGILRRDSFTSFSRVSNSQHQQRAELHHTIGLQQILTQAREVFPRLVLPQLNTQPTTFDYSQGPVSDLLNYLTSGFTTRPPIDLASAPEFEPFIASCAQSKPSSAYVIKIDDLPFDAKVSDIVAFVGGNAKILNDVDEPVHIMIERITAKTGAAYVEFCDFDSAVKVVDKHRQAKAHGKPIRIYTRIVTVSISSQDALLKDLFPYARQVRWVGGQPHINVEPSEFTGFVTEEELITLVKNVEFPHRVPYTKSAPQRSVETLISIVKKLPWYMTDYITIRQRYRIYKAVVDMMHAIAAAIDDFDRRPMQDHSKTSEVLNKKLFKRVVSAAMGCPGFTPLMKDNIAFMAGLDESHLAEYHQPSFANRWRHIYTLVPNPGLPADVIDYYVALIRGETTRMVDALPPMLRRQIRAKGKETDPYWGYFWAVVGFPEGVAFETLSLQDAANMELSAIDDILARALPGQVTQGPLT